MYKLVYSEEARYQIGKLNPGHKSQLKSAIERLAGDPLLGKRLTQELSEFWSYRSGDYRVIYKVFKKEVIILIVTIGHRKDIYKKLSR